MCVSYVRQMQLESCCDLGGTAGLVGVEGEGEEENSPSLSVNLVLFTSEQICSHFLSPLESFMFPSALILKYLL